VSATQTPQPGPPEPGPPPAAPERHCRRCGATLGPEQEWCLACGAAAQTDVARPRGWRLPLVLVGVIVGLAIAAAVLAIVELSRGPDKVAQATPTPAAATPVPTATAPTGAPENEGDQATPSATATASPSPGATVTPTPTPSATSTFPDWPAGRTAWTVILKSTKTRAEAESAAQDLQAKGDSVGILNSSDHSSLNPGYWVIYSGQYDSRSAAQSGLTALSSKPADAYVRKVSAS
jgi:predicted nucleic acid-binding Zn ribbon protein